MALQILKAGQTVTVLDRDLPGISNPDPDVEYTVQKIDPETHKSIIKRHTKNEFVRGQGKVEKTDAVAATDDVFDYILQDWKGVVDGDTAAPCTRENKLAGIDLSRRTALMDIAGANELAKKDERRRESFRAPA